MNNEENKIIPPIDSMNDDNDQVVSGDEQMQATPLEGADTPQDPQHEVVGVEPEEGGSPVGPTIGIIIIIVVIALGGLYFWGSRLNKTTENVTDTTSPEEILNEPDPSLDALNNTNTSDEIDDIEADVMNTDLNDLDRELGDIDSELNF